MLKINIICVGKIKEKYICDGIDEFKKRLSKYIKLNIIELKEEPDNNIDMAINKESKLIIDTINKNIGYNILLDIKGENISSEKLSKKIVDLKLEYSNINFIIGGSNGFNDEVRNISEYKLSFSKMTFPHQLMRLILIEQVYRAICIENNIKYHK
ncbi:23S rRNA (pseudouridine(1915)-N(3))-methyltransferase RlmH [Streptobacillus felis]|uniref:Ribosomal RNA large subunit methyltransferase H n=1 Tax=Streptobacillus felis TaxID=1384509 RepID=A0A7Z0TC27_9FUSO|nr:23S rRNA (pseudouridine(1915)-N(3))-methyltransferase RlmH [Streptobacillus felis]NYV27983.1 23S rRNA (pseudouridine(1915)-N(3))-methyltransferase RlmH [Streptobacillus felis]